MTIREMTRDPVTQRRADPSQSGARELPTICQVLHSLNVGGAEVLAYRIACRLRSEFRFVFACLDAIGPLGDELRREGFPVEFLDRQPGVDWRCARRLAAFARSHGADLLHAHQYTPFSYCIMPCTVRPRLPVLFTEHGRWFPDFPRPKRMWYNRCLLRARDRVVGVGESVRKALIDNEGLPAHRVGVIYNGVELGRFSGTAAQRVAVRREEGLTDEDRIVLQVARLDGLKDHSTAIRTLERLRRVVPRVQLWLVGEGPERGRIEDEIARRGLQDCVRLLGLRTDVGRWLAAADLFLLTSISEGIPVTLIEALAARIPIVSTQVGGIGEVVEHGVSGLLAPAGDDAGLAVAAEQLLTDQSLRQRVAAAGLQRAEERFTEEKMHGAYAACYREMIHARRS